MKKIRTLSLFSGAGGLDIGFHQAGFEIIAAVELEEKYCRTLFKNKEKNIYISKDSEILNMDVRNFKPEDYSDREIDCIIGGPPCQTFSAAGRRAGGVIGTQDLRGQLYEVYCHILDVIKPKVFIFENVYGILGANNGEDWKEVIESFRKHNYKLHFEILDTADYGVPQHRERVIMVGTKETNFKFPLPTHGPDSNQGLSLVSILEAIEDLQSSEETFSAGLGGLYGHLLPEIPEGLNYSYFTAEMGHPEPVFAWRSKFHDLLYKADKSQPSRTLKASPGKFTGPFHWKNRHFTVPELKRLQTFPDDYEIIGSFGQAMEQIGNSVPPKMAYCLAVSIREQILEKLDESQLTFPVRPLGFISTFRTRQREKNKKFKEIATDAIVKKYGSVKKYSEPEENKSETKKVYVFRENMFNRSCFEKKSELSSKEKYSEVVITQASTHIRIVLDEHPAKKQKMILTINIKGLRKYLPQYDTLTLSANIISYEDIFSCWKEIEVALVERSKFFTLIDIYGHYANRGDVVDIQGSLDSSDNSALQKCISFFSKTENCGSIVTIENTSQAIGIESSELVHTIQLMRTLRFDIRTSETHPILGDGNVLCTYPFPLLSPKALVDSKVVFNVRLANA